MVLRLSWTKIIFDCQGYFFKRCESVVIGIEVASDISVNVYSFPLLQVNILVNNFLPRIETFFISGSLIIWVGAAMDQSFIYAFTFILRPAIGTCRLQYSPPGP